VTTEPTVQADPAIAVDPTSRWQVRAHSISECVAKLSEVWSSAAGDPLTVQRTEERGPSACGCAPAC
jgi:hypothetical protein